MTYTDALHTTATPVNLSQTPMSIQRGEAVERKAITFNASWTAHQYTVHYDANGGEGSMDDQALTYDEGALAANAFSRTGYNFAGWSRTQGGSVEYTNQQAAPNVTAADGATVTLYAQWTPITYRVSFYPNGGSGSIYSQTLTYDTPATLTANAYSPSCAAYTFTGWNTRANGNGTAYDDGDEVLNLSTTPDANIILYAQWTPDLATYWHADAYHDGTTAERAYIISNATGLQLLADRVNGKNGAMQSYCSGLFFALDRGIDFNGATFDGIGFDYSFCGNFDGQGNTISNVTVGKYSGNRGLFGFVSGGTVRRVVLSNATVIGVSDGTNGALVGYLNDGTVEDCLVLGCNVAAGKNTGAIVGTALNDYTLNRNYYHACTVGGTANTTNAGVGNYRSGNTLVSGDIAGQAQAVHALTVADGVTASATPTVSHAGAGYYTAGTSVTLGGCSTDEIDYGSFTVGTRYVVSYNDGQTRTDRYIPDADGRAIVTMPAADAVVSTESYVASVDNEIAYIDADGSTKTCTGFTVVSSDYEFEISVSGNYAEASLGVNDKTERWYAVVGTVNVDKPLSIRGKARIILCDGAALRVNVDISSSQAFFGSIYGLTIYGQAQGTGALSVTNTGCAIDVDSNITINGGTVIANGTGEGIDINQGGTLTINRGTVTATGSSGIYIYQATLTQNGGTLTATGSGSYYAGIYADGDSKVGTVNILGGTLTATGTGDAFGIYAYDNATVTLGWTNATDRITATSYSTYNRGTISVKSGQILADGSDNCYYGTLDADQLAALNAKTLAPYLGFSLPDGIAILYDDDTALPVGYKNADRIAALADGKQHNVMLQGRTLYRDGEWNTLCLPFTVDGLDIRNNADNPLHGCTAMQFNTYYWYDGSGTAYDFDGDQYRYASNGDVADPQPDPATLRRSGQVDANGSLYLYFNEIYGPTHNNDLWAGKPYLVKWTTTGDPIVNPVFQKVTVTGTNPDFYTTKEGRDDETGLGNVTFRGTFTPKDYDAPDHSILFLGENNKLYYPEAGAHIGPFRAYFELGNGLTAGDPASPVRAFALSWSADVSSASGIAVVPHANDADGDVHAPGWYTLDGRRLDAQPTKKGLYIHNGHKVVVP